MENKEITDKEFLGVPTGKSDLSDPKKVQKAKVKEDLAREKELNDIRFIMNDPRGRRFFWRLLGALRTYESVFDNSGSKMAYNSGRQDVGHFLMSEITQANPEAYLTMINEAQKETTNV